MATPSQLERRFRQRSCPVCGAPVRRCLFSLEAAQFCSVNWTYSGDFRALLDLPTGAFFPIVRCLACQFVYAELLPDTDFLKVLYERVIRYEECVKGSENLDGYVRRLRYVAELIALAPLRHPLAALDFGSGLGVTLRILKACGVDAWGLDPSASRRDYATMGSGRVVDDLSDLGEARPFDLLVCDNVLEHLPEPVETLRRIVPLLATDAVAFVSVPSYEPRILDAQAEAVRRGEPVSMALNPWEHLNYFSLHHLDGLMREIGFTRLPAHRRRQVDIGLRPERRRDRRIRNAMASIVRLCRYALTGDGGETTEAAFYCRESIG